MTTLELVSISRRAPVPVLDRVLTAAEEALDEIGASRVWIDQQGDMLTVVAEFAPA